MLSIEQCGAHLLDDNLTDEQVKNLRDSLYELAEQILYDCLGGAQPKFNTSKPQLLSI